MTTDPGPAISSIPSGHADDPESVSALCASAARALKARRPQAAAALAERAIMLHPRDAEAHLYLGMALRQGGRLADAIETLRRAVTLQPDNVGALHNLGAALLESGDAGAAQPHLERALALRPLSAAVHVNLGSLYRQLMRPDESIAALRRAIELDPQQAQAHNNLGQMQKEVGDIEAAVAAYRHAIDLAPHRADYRSNLLLALNHCERVSARDIAAEHRAFGEHFGEPAGRLPSKAHTGRLRIGYVSSDFRGHAVANFFEPLLRAHDREHFEIFCYYNFGADDAITAEMRALAEHFESVRGLSDDDLARRIREDSIDVLVDLNGHTSFNRLRVFMLRPAPIQVTWLGYPGSTGMRAMDYRLTDGYAAPPGLTEELHSEALWRLPRTQWCYRPYDFAPEVGPLPASANGFITFASLNNPAKVQPTIMRLWAQILRQLPDARLLLGTASHPRRRAELDAFFAEQGIAAGRVTHLGWLPTTEYLALYGKADIALDTWPYAGGTTTCDALWMGVPVVTLAGERTFSRSGASILSNVGLAEWVAATPAQYVAAAVAFAQDSAGLVELRRGLRARMQASPLTDAVQFARDIEAAYTAMWQRDLTRAASDGR